MTQANKTILVVGATGQQGGATARRLLGEGWRVRALVRDAASPGARRLALDGAQLVVGDMDDRDSIRDAVRDAHGVFSVQPSYIPPLFADNELERGIRVVDVAHDAGVRHAVYASVAGVDRNMGIPHWDVKRKIEQHLRGRGLPFTILRPTWFMENFAHPTYSLTTQAIPPRALVQLIALDDIGAFAALAFRDPDVYVGKAIELAGDELTLDDLLVAIGRATGRYVPAIRGGSGAARPERFGGWNADIAALRKIYPPLMTFDAWLAKAGARMIEQLVE